MANKLTAHTCFSDDVNLNMELKNSGWRVCICCNDILPSENLVNTLAQNYCLYKYVADHLEVYTITFIGNNGNTKDVKLDGVDNIFNEQIQTNADKNLPKVYITLDDVRLRVRYRQGDIVAKDTNCDSVFMKGAMR